MKHYLIIATASIPYPVKEEIQIEASSFGTAIRRALNKYRAKYPGRRIDEFNIRAVVL